MIIDKQALLASSIALGATGTTYGDVYDLQQSRDIGVGETIELFLAVTTAATSGGAATLTVNLVTDDNSAMSSPTVLQNICNAVPVASLTAGQRFVENLQPGSTLVPMERYLAYQIIVGTAAFTAGVIQGGIVNDAGSTRMYPKNFSTF